jgi:hypothetical protein
MTCLLATLGLSATFNEPGRVHQAARIYREDLSKPKQVHDNVLEE